MFSSPVMKNSRGFTLIEMIVSLAVFAVVVTITGGALLTLIATNQRFHYEQSIMTNLSFALDSMTRELRMGYNYVCVVAGSPSAVPFGTSVHEESDGGVSGVMQQDCLNGRKLVAGGAFQRMQGISFFEGGNSLTGAGANRILYYYDRDFYGTNRGALFRRVGNNDPERLTSDEVFITFFNMYVSGTDQLLASGSDVVQPSITLVIEAQAVSDTSATPKLYLVETTITQRSLDL